MQDPVHPIKIINQDTPGRCRYVYVINDTICVLDETSIEVYTIITTDIGQCAEKDRPLFNLYPNPFQNRLRISYQIPQKDSTIINIYDVLGSLIKSFRNLSGDSYLIWNGQDDNGNQLPAGIYFVRLMVNNKSVIRKVVMLR